MLAYTYIENGTFALVQKRRFSPYFLVLSPYYCGFYRVIRQDK